MGLLKCGRVNFEYTIFNFFQSRSNFPLKRNQLGIGITNITAMSISTYKEVSSRPAECHPSAATVHFSSVSSSEKPCSMPLKKRFTKTYQMEFFAASTSSINAGGSGIDSCGANRTRSSSLDSSCGSLDEEKSALDLCGPKGVLTPGVIRHSSQPQMPLAYYYLQK